MGKTIKQIEREFGHSYTESLTINTEPGSLHMREAREMAGDRDLSLSLRERLSMN